MAVTFTPTHLITGAAISNLSNGNLTADAVTSGTGTKFATVGKRTGKWYWEIVTGAGTNDNAQVGIATIQHLVTDTLSVGGGYAIAWRAGGALYSGTSQRISAASMVVTPQSCTVGIAIDCDLRRIWLARNNSWVLSGDPANNSNPTVDAQWFEGNLLFPAVSPYYAMTAQFASGSLTYTPPNGFSALTDSSDFTNAVEAPLPENFPTDDWQDGGRYKLTGTVSRLGVPGRYRVRLYEKFSGRLVRETWSATDGTYTFNRILSKDYFVIAFDHTADGLLVADIIDTGLVLEAAT